MFTSLIASGGRRGGWIRNPWVIAASVGAHLLIFAGMIWAMGREPAAAPEPEPEQVTYIDITSLPPPPEEIFEAPPAEAEAVQEAPRAEPQAAAPAPTPRRPPATPRTTTPSPPAPDRQAGFQELRTPTEVAGIPAPDVSAPPVRAEDFGGRGAVGGSAAGTAPVVAAPRTTAPGGTGTGRGTGTGSGTGTGTGEGAPTGTFTSNMVDRAAELQNRNDVARTLQRLYPAMLRDAGVGGQVVVELVVGADGRVESGSVRVVSATHEGFRDPSVRAVESFRFRPAQVGPHRVRMRVQIPIVWQLERG